MKILLIVGHNGIYSGASYQALYLALGLQERGHEVHCVWGPEEGDSSLDIIKRSGLTLHTISMQGKFHIRALRTLRALLKTEAFDVMHCFKGMAMYRALWASWGIAIPALVFNREVSKQLEYFQGAKYRSRRVDLVVADSEAVRQIVLQSGKVRVDKVAVVYDEVDLQRYHPQISGANVRREFQIKDQDFFCGVIGNYALWRGQEYFLQAIDLIRQKLGEQSNLKFLIVGKDTDRLLPLVNKLSVNSALFLSGFRQDLEQVVAALDVIVNCSIGVESLSGAITIAMAMGKPVIGTAIAGTPELIEDGITGLLVPPTDAQKLADAILRIAALSPDERALMGRKARSKMEQHFSRSARAERMESLYMDIHRKKGKSVA
ncbi:MAG: glycosyltransferase family 4 protein [bacterium]